MAEYEITEKLDTLNEYIEAERSNKYAAAQMKKKNTKICQIAAMQIKGKIDPLKQYDVEITWCVTNNRQDPDNVYSGVKYILDGLVKAKVIKNDGRKNIRFISHKIFTMKKYCVFVQLKEV